MKKLLTFLFILLTISCLYAETISDKLITISNIKGNLKTAIEAKGQTVTASFSSYAPAIASIGSPFMWGGSTDWTLASTTATSTFYQDFPALASVVTDVNGTNEDDYNSSVISEYDTFFNDAGLSRLPGSYSRTIHVPPANSIGTYTTVSIRNGYRCGMNNVHIL